MRIRLFLLSVLLLASFSPLSFSPALAQGDDVAQILGRINALRQQSGLLPLDLNSTLTASAQRHSDDMARTGNIDHTGSDGSSVESRIREAGYGHWRDFGIWGENIYGGQMADVDAAWNFWINSPVHRANIVKPRFREIGIGVGHSDHGTYYTLNFGAQPNVLPFFVTGSVPAVTLLLSNETDISTGEGVSIMGQATQVRVAEGTDTSSAGWQPWAASIPFRLSDATGRKTITVEYKDNLGRGSKFSRTFDTSDWGTTVSNPTLSPTATTAVTSAATATSVATATRAASATPTNTGTPAPTATGTMTPTPSPTPQPTETPTATETSVPTGTPQPTETATAQATSTATSVIPTATLMPLASPTQRVKITPQLIAANLATYPSASHLTPPAPRPAAPERPLFDFADTSSRTVFGIVLGLQAIVLVVVGVTVVARVRRRS